MGDPPRANFLRRRFAGTLVAATATAAGAALGLLVAGIRTLSGEFAGGQAGEASDATATAQSALYTAHAAVGAVYGFVLVCVPLAVWMLVCFRESFYAERRRSRVRLTQGMQDVLRQHVQPPGSPAPARSPADG